MQNWLWFLFLFLGIPWIAFEGKFEQMPKQIYKNWHIENPYIVNYLSEKVRCKYQTFGLFCSHLSVDKCFRYRLVNLHDFFSQWLMYIDLHCTKIFKYKNWVSVSYFSLSDLEQRVTKCSEFLQSRIVVFTIKIQLSVLVQGKMELIIISSKCTLISSWNSWKIAQLVLSNNRFLSYLTGSRWSVPSFWRQ
jgi:hypothetical protein